MAIFASTVVAYFVHRPTMHCRKRLVSRKNRSFLGMTFYIELALAAISNWSNHDLHFFVKLASKGLYFCDYDNQRLDWLGASCGCSSGFYPAVALLRRPDCFRNRSNRHAFKGGGFWICLPIWPPWMAGMQCLQEKNIATTLAVIGLWSTTYVDVFC